MYVALFALALLARGAWESSETHPAVQVRIDEQIRVMDAHGLSRAAAVMAVSGFATLRLVQPGAPGPERQIGEIATRDNWEPTDGLF